MKKVLIALLLCFTVIHLAEAQTDTCKSNNWYLDFAIGEGAMLTDQINQLEYPNFLSHRLSIGFGKWLNPWFGLRFQTNGGPLHMSHRTSNSFTDDYIQDEYIINCDPDGYYLAKAPFVNPHIDLQFSLISMFCYPQTKWDALISVGAGYIHVFKEKGIPHYNGTTLNTSLMAKCRLSSHWELNIEAQGTFVSDKFDARITDKKYALNTSLNVGANYFFKGRCFEQPIIEEVIDMPIIQKIVDSIYVRDTIKEYVEKVVEKEALGQPIAAFSYEIGEIYPVGLAEQTIKQVAKILKENPTKKIRLDSYADKETGSQKRNMDLATQRIWHIRDILIEKYEISKDRIIEKPYGSSVQLFNTSESIRNRVTWVFLLDE